LIDAALRSAASDDQEQVDVVQNEEDPVDYVDLDSLSDVDHEDQEQVDEQALDNSLHSVVVVDRPLVLVFGFRTDLYFKFKNSLPVFKHCVDNLKETHHDQDKPVEPLWGNSPIRASLCWHVEWIRGWVASRIEVQPLVTILEVVGVSELPDKTEVVLAKDEEGNKEDEQDTCLSVNLFVCSVEHEEEHVSQVLDVVDVRDSVEEQEQ
jgi:hypothetical protein